MKPHVAEINEGPEAYERFQKAVKAIVGVRKSDVIADRQKTHRKNKNPVNRKG